METPSMRLLIHSAAKIIAVASPGVRKLAGNDMKQLHVLEPETEDGTLAIAVNRSGLVECIDNTPTVVKQYSFNCFDHVIDASGCCIIPGLVDAHSHPVWDGDRVDEFKMKLEGATYMDIHKRGLGIYYTVDKTKQVSESTLLESLVTRLRSMSRCGSTLVECKTGYGLDLETELKMLRVIESARDVVDVDISCTYLGAHAVPRGKTNAEAKDDIIDVQLPYIKQCMNSGEIRVDQIDVFCEKGVFDVNQTAEILRVGEQLGLRGNFHAEELSYLGCPEKILASLHVDAISHLEEISEDGIIAMSQTGCVAVILPTTAQILKLKPPPVRSMIRAGVSVALGSDFNPNAHTYSMPIVMYLACVTLGMTAEEALAASTINAAAALGMSHSHGSVEVGKVANLLVLNGLRWEHLIYKFGCHNDVISHVIHRGSIVHINEK